MITTATPPTEPAGAFLGSGFGPQATSATGAATAAPRIEVTRKEAKPGRVAKIRGRRELSAAPEVITETGGHERARYDAGENVPAEVAQLRALFDGLQVVTVSEDARQQAEQVAWVRAGRATLATAAAAADAAGDAALLRLQHGHGDPAATVEDFIVHEARRAACQRALATFPPHIQPVPPAVLDAARDAVALLAGAVPDVAPPAIVGLVAQWSDGVNRRSVQLGGPQAYSSAARVSLPPRVTDAEQVAIDAHTAWSASARAVRSTVTLYRQLADALGPDVDAALNLIAACDTVLREQVPQVARQGAAVQKLIAGADSRRAEMEIGS